MTPHETKLTRDSIRRRYFPKDNDITAGANKALAEVRKMSKSETARHLAEEAGVSEKASSNGCALFAAGIPVLVIAAAVALAFGAGNINQRAHAITQAKKFKAEYERTGSSAAFDAYIKWEREVSRLLREAQEAAYQKQATK